MQNIDTICAILESLNKDSSNILKTLMEAYGFSKTTIKRVLELDSSSTNGIKVCRQKFLYKEVAKGSNLENEILDLLQHAVKNERFLIVTDGEYLIARDTRYDHYLDIEVSKLVEHYEFFLPWIGKEKVEEEVENPADVKAASEMGRLFSAIKQDNESLSERELNVFLTRILFCFFADDTGIFEKNQFSDSIRQNTADDGHDMTTYLDGLFDTLDIPENRRANCKPCYKHFPYVNGALFKEKLSIPVFTNVSRRKLLECCMNDWSGISPDIFGSMFQTVISEDQRRSLGQHYTSMPNIMKVLNPLFLNELHAELDSIKDMADVNSPIEERMKKDKKLDAFRIKLERIKVFDPACGSGNFLIVAYKALCRLEIEAIQEYYQTRMPMLSIHLDRFYGIEIDDFPCEIARLSLWLIQHQMTLECKKFGIDTNPTLPLSSTGNIVCCNALRMNWNDVCPVEENDIVYVCGNPPFAGHQTKTESQRMDIQTVFNNRIYGTTDLDYVSCWFIKGSDFIRGHKNRKLGLVSTNSVNQGKHVKSLWPAVLMDDEEIFFGYESFKWTNNASNKAGVTVTIIGLRNKCNDPKYLYSESESTLVENINPYLRNESNSNAITAIQRIPKGLPKCGFGTMFIDGGNLILSTHEKDDLLRDFPSANKFIKKLIGAEEFIKGKERYCLWISNDELQEAESIPFINARLNACKDYRENNPKKEGDAYKNRDRYWQPREYRDVSKPAIIIPSVSSERREYIPIGYLSAGTVIVAPNFALYDASLWLFAVLTSRIHMVWVRAVAGKLETRIRYSNTLCYNAFPFPSLSNEQKTELEETALLILKYREFGYDANHKNLADLYDPDKMPEELRKAHEANNLLVDSIYRKSGFKDDNERLAELFKRYKEMVGEK